MRTKLARFLLHTAFGLGLCASTATLVQAEDYHMVPHGQGYSPVYVQPNCPAPVMPAPGMPAPAPAPTPGAPAVAPAPDTTNVPAPTETAPTAEATGAEVAGGVPIGGRGDSSNRFNLFDTQSAIPGNRVWFGFQRQDDFRTGFRVFPSTLSSGTANVLQQDFTHTRNENLYRVGGEIALGKKFSIAFEDQYIATTGSAFAADAWGDPEFMLKYAVLYSDHTVVSAILGFQPQVASHDGELHEKDTRYLPGFLFYHDLSDNLFVQGGVQVSISDRNLTDSIDYSLSLGYWLYRAECTADHTPFLTGIIPQVEVFGKNVISNGRNVPFELPGSFLSNGSAATSPFASPFAEPRNVYDVTAGGLIELKKKVLVGSYVSIPISGGDVRKLELIATLNFRF